MDMDALVDELRRDEGERLFPYRDSVGKLTVGVGHNLDDKGISREASAFLLREDIAEVVAGLNAALPWWTTLDAVRQRVLANMAFNMGVAGLLQFRQTLAAVRGGAYEAAAKGMLGSLWARQVGPRAVRLAEMMRTGQAPAPLGVA
jgi:lysozyme